MPTSGPSAADSFVKLVREEAGPSYRAILKHAIGRVRKNGPESRGALYDDLKRRKYVCKNDQDVMIYITKVACKHHKKFLALFDSLFTEEKLYQFKMIDLVIWGAGCGLDLAALYDRTMKEEKPQRRLNIHSIVLIDSSGAALSYATELARLFYAPAEISEERIDLRRLFQNGPAGPPAPDAEKTAEAIALETRLNDCHFKLTPRLHLFSNLLDLFSEKEAGEFARAVLSLFKKSGSYRESAVVYSPTYSRAPQKIDAFVKVFSEDPECYEDFGTEKEIEKCTYRCFHYTANPELRALYHALKKTGENIYSNLYRIAETDPGLDWIVCWEELSIRLGEKLGENYRAAAKKDDVLYLIPKQGSGRRIVALHLKPEKHTALKLQKKDGDGKFEKAIWNDAVAPFRNEGLPHEYRYFLFLKWDGRGGTVDWASCRYRKKELLPGCEEPENYLSLFIPNTDGIEPLPDYRERAKGRDAKQQNIIEDRRQLRKVRGGPGTGKTFTMLWHGIEFFKRTHQPVLFIVKTHTLCSILERRFWATLKAQIGPEDFNDSQILSLPEVDVMTAKKFLYAYRQDENFRAGAAREDSESFNWKDQSEWDRCPRYGAVLIDELQLIPPWLAQFIYDVTEYRSPARQFYCFCDEEQTLGKTDILELGTEGGDSPRFKIVKVPRTAPGKSFGRFVTLKNHHRTEVPKLFALYNAIRAPLFSASYDLDELQMVNPNANDGFFFPSFEPFDYSKADAVCERPGGYGIDADGRDQEERLARGLAQACRLRIRGILKGHFSSLKRQDPILLLCDSANLAKTLPDVLEKDYEGYAFYRTHLSPWKREEGEEEREEEEEEGEEEEGEEEKREKERERKEKSLRRDFYQRPGTIHITTVDCCQGHTFDNVIFLITDENLSHERFFTGLTRAQNMLHVIDMTPRHKFFDLLNRVSEKL